MKTLMERSTVLGINIDPRGLFRGRKWEAGPGQGLRFLKAVNYREITVFPAQAQPFNEKDVR